MKLALVVVLLLWVAMIDPAAAGEDKNCDKSIKKKKLIRSKVCEHEEKIQQLADQLSQIQAQLKEGEEEEEEEPEEGADPMTVDGTASQSSTGWGGVAERAFDRNENSNYFHGRSCTHTLHENNPWWKVVFNERVKVTKVKLVNRSDCCSDRLHHILVTVDGKTCFMHDEAIGSSLEQACDSPISGTEVKVTLEGQKEYLTLCEVVVS